MSILHSFHLVCSTSKYAGIIFSILTICVACNGCSSSEAGAAATRTQPEDLAVSVEVVSVAEHSFEQEIEIPSNILPLRQVVITPRVPGRLSKVLVNAGDHVESGQVVAQLDRRDFLLAVKQAKAATTAASSGVNLATIASESAQTSFDRMSGLRKSGAITQSDMDKVNDGHRMGLAKLDAAQAQVQLARVGLSAAQTKLSDTVMRAPFAGVVLQRMLDEGSLCNVMPPTPVMVIAEVETMKVEGSVSERDRLSVKVGMPAKVIVDALRGKVLTGTISIINPMVDPRTRTAKLQINLSNPGYVLETGMSARVVLELGERESIAVPDETVLRGGAAERAAVFVVEGSGIAKRRDVVVGIREGGLIEITEGLEVGEKIIRSGHVGLIDGARVLIVESESDSDAPSEESTSTEPRERRETSQQADPSADQPEPSQQRSTPATTTPAPSTPPAGDDAGQMNLGDIIVGERLTRREIRRVVDGARGELLSCYQAERARNSALGAQSISITVSVSVRGAVRAARAMPAGSMSTCLEGAMRRLQFSELGGAGDERAAVELTFEPGRTM